MSKKDYLPNGQIYVNALVPSELERKLRIRAAEHGISRAELVRRFIIEGLKYEEGERQ